jgi:hypothetical protein
MPIVYVVLGPNPVVTFAFVMVSVNTFVYGRLDAVPCSVTAAANAFELISISNISAANIFFIFCYLHVG